MRSFWVVSPNVEGKASDWKPIILREHIAVMGWGPNNEMGEKFIRIPREDVILIARRHHGRADVVALGVVNGPAEPGNRRGECKRFVNPTRFGSLRNLAPFVPVLRAPKQIPLVKVLRHTKALRELHPKHDPVHRQVCDWIEHLLGNAKSNRPDALLSHQPKVLEVNGAVHVANPPKDRDYDYKFQTEKTIVEARKREAELLEAYRAWIQQKYRYVPKAIKSMNLTNDCFDECRRNLIEAKASTKREDIRMAVGQLFDYGFYAAKQFGKLNRAILLPKKPAANVIEWLKPLDIGVIWRVRGSFRDNSGKKFV